MIFLVVLKIQQYFMYLNPLKNMYDIVTGL